MYVSGNKLQVYKHFIEKSQFPTTCVILVATLVDIDRNWPIRLSFTKPTADTQGCQK